MARKVIKRRHTELHPEVKATMNGKIRNHIVKCIYDNGGVVNHSKYADICRHLQLDKTIKTDPLKWHKRNEKYVKVVNRNNDTFYKLTRIGNNLAKIVLS